MDLTTINAITSYVIYGAQALTALWGAFCVAMVYLRVGQKSFANEEAQAEWLNNLEKPLAAGDFTTAAQICEGDQRAVPQLASLGIAHRKEGYKSVRQLLLDRLQRDLLADLDYRVSWVNTVIKSAPMLGLFGTVAGMMLAFYKLANPTGTEGSGPSATNLASDISLALITTAVGLAIAIPLILALNGVNIQIKSLEDLVTSGLSRFLDMFRRGLEKAER
jgi:biopolymer transport protein ExbB/TolQ